MENIRNFCIIAHIDHGKSTLADRMLEITGTIAKHKMEEQFLDRMDIERERGITIKLQPVRMLWHTQIRSMKPEIQTRSEIQSTNDQNNSEYRNPDSEPTSSEYILNLIDTPGHVDFSYEVSRSLAAVEGALLVVDATQGIEAQTLSNAYLAIDQGLTIIPVINKIDLPQAHTELVRKQLQEIFGFRDDEIIVASAKTGQNVEQILDAIVTIVPPPSGSMAAPVRALIFDSNYDKFKGVICHIRVVDGKLYPNKSYQLFAAKTCFIGLETGVFMPDFRQKDCLEAGEIGYIATGLKDVAQARVGDTIIEANNKQVEPLPGYKEITPMVFAGLYPIDSNEYPKLRDALQKLKLNDASLRFEPENSEALGFGFRCGFLGLLHMDVVRERLEREYNLSLILSAPSVQYLVRQTNDEVLVVDSPSKFPDRTYITSIQEPMAKATIITTEPYLGKLIELVNQRRGTVENVEYIGGPDFAKATPNQDTILKRAKISAELPLAEIVTDFFDILKSISSGYASLDYEVAGLKEVDAIKLEILVSGQIVDALARIVPRKLAERLGRESVERLKDVIPRQQYEVAIQAALGGSKGVAGKIIARADVKAYRKDVIGYLYGGDRSRKDKLLDKQKAGKKRMKKIGKVALPQEAFLAVFRQSA